MTVKVASAPPVPSPTVEAARAGAFIHRLGEAANLAMPPNVTGLSVNLPQVGRPTTGAIGNTVVPLQHETYRPEPAPLARSDLVAEWHGQVSKVLEDSFVAELRGVFGHNVGGSLEEAEIPLAEVRPDDTGLVREGAFFRLCISYEQAINGTRRRFTEVIFRRLPAYRREELEEAAREAADILRGIRVE